MLFLGAVALYSPTVRHDFINYDDPDYVTANSHVQKGLTPEGVAWAFGRLHGEKTYWHPVTWLSHMLDCQLFGLQAGWHHFINVLFHAINAVLLFWLLRQMTGATWRSCMVAALFAVHPLQVDTVAWVTERKNVLSTMFWMLTLLAWVRYASWPRSADWQSAVSPIGNRRDASVPTPPKGARSAWYGLALVFFAFGLMSKPSVVTLPCVMLLLDLWPLNRLRSAEGQPRSPLTGLILEKAPFFALAAFLSWLTLKSHVALGITQAGHGLPWWLRIENAIVSYARYLGKTIWPTKLAVLYPHPGKWPDSQVLGSGLLLAAITVFVVWYWRSRTRNSSPLHIPLPSDGRGQGEGFPSVRSSSPANPSFSSFPSVRNSSAPMIGWLWFLGVLVPAIGLLQIGVQAMADRFVYVPIIGLFMAAVWALANSARQSLRKLLPAAGILIVATYAIVTSQQLKHWRNSVTLYEHTLRVTTNNYVVHNNLGYALIDAGREEDAVWHMNQALKIKPDFIQPALQLANFYVQKRQWKLAEPYLGLVVEHRPTMASALRGHGDILVRIGDTNKAVERYEALLRQSPSAELHTLVASLLARVGKPTEALEHSRAALRIEPNAAPILNNIAWILATHPDDKVRDGAEAVRLAERACEVTGRYGAVYIGTLAAAYAEAGRFDDAVRTGEEATKVAEDAGQAELAAKNRQLIQLYKSGKPFRETSTPAPNHNL